MTASAAALLNLARTELGAEYDVLRPLGDGGMGAVFLARERALQRLVAIKVLDPDLAASPVFRLRFEREAQTAAQLTHPNIVPIYRVGTSATLVYFVMQYVDGPSLAERMRGAGRMPLSEALRHAREIAAALGAAHRRGVIHRDVKPQNVLFDVETGRCMVTDFGIASVSGAADRSASPDGEPLTGAGMVMGTPRYMSPEQATGVRDLTAASDLYALGVLLYEMLTGAYPYRVGEPPNFLLAHLTQTMIPLVARVGDMPRDVEVLVGTLLAKAADERYATADALIDDLDMLRGVMDGARSGGQRRLGLGRMRRSGAWIRARWRLVASLVFASMLAGVAVPMLLNAKAEVPAGAAARNSVLLGFFENSTPDRNLDWLRIGGVEYLAQSLGRWRDMRVLDAEGLLALARRSQLRDEAPLSKDDALELARQARMWTATVGSVIRADDSLRVTLRVYDVGSRVLVETLQESAADEDALPAAFERLAAQLLQLAGAPAEVREALDPPTRSVAAYKAYVEGVGARSRWRLEPAIAAFQRAVELDTTFALAYYELAQAIGALGDPFRNERMFAYADTAVMRAESRPERERLLIRAYQAFLRADLPAARQLYEQVLAVDSTITDAIVGLADVYTYDRTLVPDGPSLRFPMQPTAALRLYERALAINPGDQRTYASLADLLATAGQPEALIGGYREKPTGNLTTLFLRVPTRTWVLLLRGDSLQLVPSDSLLDRFAPAVVDSLRKAARQRASDVIARWQRQAPGEAQPFAVRTGLRQLDRDFDGALRDLAEAERRGAALPVPAAIVRLAILLDARRFAAAAALADSLDRVRGRDSASSVFAEGPRFTTQALRGRVNEALAGVERQVAELRRRGSQAALLLRFDVADISRPLRARAILETTSTADVRSAAARIEQLITRGDAADRAELRTSVARSIAFAAASVGDTTTTREWQRGAPGIEFSVEIAAWAAANAGDLPGAARVLAALPSDTVRSPLRLYARALTERALGRPEAALRTLQRLDSAPVSIGGGSVPDWIMLGKAVLQRAELYEAIGDRDHALENYRMVAALWMGADPVLQPDRQRALTAIAELSRRRAGDPPAAGTPLTGVAPPRGVR